MWCLSQYLAAQDNLFLQLSVAVELCSTQLAHSESCAGNYRSDLCLTSCAWFLVLFLPVAFVVFA